MSQISLRRPHHPGIVIVGGGLAGQRCAETLRRHGYDGAIRMICAEEHRPYDRPPLSKELLAGSGSEDPPAYRAIDWYRQESIDLLLGVAATALRPAERRVLLSDGTALRYERLLIASGSRPRRLPLVDGYENVWSLRTVDDCRALRAVLAGRRRLAVMGAGFIGLEVAATARGIGGSVTIIEGARAPLAGVLGHELGRWFARLHEARGVRVLTNCTIERTHGHGAIRALRLSTGRVVVADDVVVGVGVEPDVGWLSGSGLRAAGGVPVDPHGRTAIEGVLAAGDAADSVEFDGDPGAASFTATFNRAGRAVAALLVNRPRSLPAARQLIEKGNR